MDVSPTDRGGPPEAKLPLFGLFTFHNISALDIEPTAGGHI